MTTQNYLIAIQNRYEIAQLNSEMKQFIKGLEGEVYFKQLLKKQHNILYINNLNLNFKNRVQIDFLVISDQSIYHFEVKHYSGDYYIRDNQFTNSHGNIFSTPFQQIERANHEIQQIMDQNYINRELKSFLVFTHPTFTLKSPLPSNINSLMPTELYKLSNMFSNYKPQENRKIFQIFKEAHSDFSQFYQNITKIPFNYINPGLKCYKCHQIECIKYEDNKVYTYCNHCQRKLDRKSLYLFNLKELYFCKGEQFTVTEGTNWCRAKNIYTIKRVCDKYFKYNVEKPRYYYLDNV
ncbi:nuclease-related domain-containing protein [Mammaliicoccus stepanovicii]|uniref:Nuclease-related domain n=1 Tax=Mammaliicoccus stepanovicii TaxID=643214 RepID=A0A239ZAS1_9STAP|nr:nuclease-related domain-containing protein [Mammaliicoccus stepanovicii]PNZ74104.1 NERD domain-containing protein [Mammaliicoccus stepanovicii]GGI42142.1 hypothetical protein GCM10010896_16940 [Mammaliicoccus stepanovicii]SNV68289.1 Nuclease-related domain [Mammaliicoccus stepanovicii]